MTRLKRQATGICSELASSKKNSAESMTADVKIELSYLLNRQERAFKPSSSKKNPRSPRAPRVSSLKLNLSVKKGAC
jgi:hypothetical protein